MSSPPSLTTNEVELTAKCLPSLSATFNRRLISAQHVANAVGNLNLDQFKAQVGTRGNQPLDGLTGDMAGKLTGFLDRVPNSGILPNVRSVRVDPSKLVAPTWSNETD